MSEAVWAQPIHHIHAVWGLSHDDSWRRGAAVPICAFIGSREKAGLMTEGPNRAQALGPQEHLSVSNELQAVLSWGGAWHVSWLPLYKLSPIGTLRVGPVL